MKERHNVKKYESGQVIIIVALGLIALIAMAALIVDGAIIMSHRRTAQAAADAAALAGAEYLCPHVYDTSSAESEARSYVALNNATVVEPIAFPESNTIHVEASVESQSFFARILNETELSANAVAEASCTPLSTGAGTLPVVFPCQEDDPVCGMKFYDEDHDDQWNIEHGNYTIIHESDAQSPFCDDPDVNVHCSNVVAWGDRGWVSLDGSNNKTNMTGWISGTLIPPQIAPGYWLSSLQGGSVSWFGDIIPYVGNDFIVPIYDAHCGNSPPSTNCEDLFLPGDNDSLTRSGNGIPSFRIIGFGLFKVTCVQDKNKPDCPYRAHLETLGFSLGPGNSVKSVEGYFISGTYPTGGGEGLDLGLYTVHLRR